MIDGQIKNRIEEFSTYLMQCGALVLPPTNQWEMIRFRCDKGTGIIYANKRGQLNYSGPAQEAWDFFQRGQKWSCIDKEKRTKRIIVMDELIRRDGDACFYCGEKFDNSGAEYAPTLEHLLSISCGGNNHIANLALAHQICNSRASDMALIDKIKFRESLMRG